MRTWARVSTLALGMALGGTACYDLIGGPSDYIVGDPFSTGGQGGSGANTGGTGGNAAGGDGGSTTVCSAGTTEPCYSGPDGTEGIGTCKSGTRTCAQDGSSWSECVGEVKPTDEICANQEDEDCNGAACGAILLQRTFDASGDLKIGMRQIGDGSLRMAGSFFGGLGIGMPPLVSVSVFDGFLAHFDANLTNTFADTRGTTVNVLDAAFDDAGNTALLVFMASNTDLGTGMLSGPGMAAAVYDTLGNPLQVWSLGGGTPPQDCGAITLRDNEIAMMGCFNGSISFGPSTLVDTSGDTFFARMDVATGDEIVATQLSGIKIRDIVSGGGGSVFATGDLLGTLETPSGPISTPGDADLLVAKLSNAGAVEWAHAYGDDLQQRGFHIAVDALGDPVVAGRFEGTITFGMAGEVTKAPTSQGDLVVMKHFLLGPPTWIRAIGGMGLTLLRGYPSQGRMISWLQAASADPSSWRTGRWRVPVSRTDSC